MHAIEIQGLSKDYAVGFWKKQQRPGLNSLNLNVEVGETFGFLGPNGAGKTTTLKLLMGIIFPTSGSARILGKDCLDPEVKQKIGFLPEQPYFYDYLSAPELLDYYAHLSGVPAAVRALLRHRPDVNAAGVDGTVPNDALAKFVRDTISAK